MTAQNAWKIGVAAGCPDCHGSGWRWRTPDGFNPFLAGGHATARAMYQVECDHRRHAAALAAPSIIGRKP